MRAQIVATVLRREWAETIRNRLLMATILIPPVILTIAPLPWPGWSVNVPCRLSLPPRSSPSVRSGRVSRG